MVKNLPSKVEDVGLIPGRGSEISHAIGQRSSRAATTEPRATAREAHVPQPDRSPRIAMKTQCSQRNQKFKNINK